LPRDELHRERELRLAVDRRIPRAMRRAGDRVELERDAYGLECLLHREADLEWDDAVARAVEDDRGGYPSDRSSGCIPLR